MKASTMTVPAALQHRTMVRPARGTITRRRAVLPTAKPINAQPCPELSTAELAFHVYAAFRAEPHINNVLTHISRTRWAELEQSINSILDPATTSDRLSPLGQNIVELMVAERGPTGRILKPYFHAVLYNLLQPSQAERLISRIEALFLDLEWKAQHLTPRAPPSPRPAMRLAAT
jgi:hypothetical protein